MSATCLTPAECRATAAHYRRQAETALQSGQRHTASEWLRVADWFTHLAAQRVDRRAA